VPVLYDKQTQRIVNNESADIMRMLATAFKVHLLTRLMFGVLLSWVDLLAKPAV
jgi:glutathionyl-hydroquinone reductase